VPSLSIAVVPDSGTGQLTGITGKMQIVIAGGKHPTISSTRRPSRPERAMIGDPPERERRPLMLALGGGVIAAGALVALVFTLGPGPTSTAATRCTTAPEAPGGAASTVSDASQASWRRRAAVRSPRAVGGGAARGPRAGRREWTRSCAGTVADVAVSTWATWCTCCTDDRGRLQDYVLLGP
jgi:hypothetical protein